MEGLTSTSEPKVVEEPVRKKAMKEAAWFSGGVLIEVCYKRVDYGSDDEWCAAFINGVKKLKEEFPPDPAASGMIPAARARRAGGVEDG